MFRIFRRTRVRPVIAGALAAAAVSLGAAWAPAPASDHGAAGEALANRMSAIAGVYVLQRASGKKPPIPFAMSVVGGDVAGTVDGARVVLASDGSYTNDIVVTWTETPMLPIPGLSADGKPHTLAGSGRYEMKGDTLVLKPADMFSRGIVRTVAATTGEKELDLVSASGGLAGSRVPINAHFVRIRD